MIVLGLLLLLGTAGLSFALYQANQDVFATSVGTVELLGRHAQLTAGQVFMTGAAAGALVILSLVMLFGGMGRRSRRNRTFQSDLSTERVGTHTADKEPALR